MATAQSNVRPSVEGEIGRGRAEITLVGRDSPGPPALAEKIISALPGTGILFCSGYSAEYLADRGIDANARNFLQKPYRAAKLQRKVEQLPPGGAAQSGHHHIQDHELDIRARRDHAQRLLPALRHQDAIANELGAFEKVRG